MLQYSAPRGGKALAILLLAILNGCGEDSDRPSDVHTLRVLAVRSETPFAKPGADVQLSMLAYDGSPRAKLADGSNRVTSTLWLGGCVNPPGDSYAECVPYLHTLVDQLGDASLASEAIPANVPPGVLGWGQTFTAHMPTDIISERSVAEGVVYPYGVQMVYFAYCGGELRRINVGQTQFPLGCFDSQTGEQLGRDDFDFGFYPVFSYDTIENQNPVLSALRFAGNDVAQECSDDAPCAAGFRCGSESICIPIVQRCTESDADKCENYSLSVEVPRSSVGRAVAASVAESDAPPETLWVSYYASAGSFKQDAEMINDPSTGWNDNSAGKWRAHTDSNREARLWAVVRDNRNGVAWAWRDVWVE